MKHRRSHTARLIFVAGLALATAATAGCSDSTRGAKASVTTAAGATTTNKSNDPTTAPGAATSAASAPEIGDCLEPMTPALAAGYQLPAIVPCNQPHGGEIVSIATLSSSSSAPYPAMGRSLTGADQQTKQCVGTGGDAQTFLGSNAITIPESATSIGVTEAWRVTGLDSAIYVPGPAAWSAGERWLACAVILNNTINAPSQYTGTAKEGRSKPGALPSQLAWCKKQQSGTTDFSAVPCDQPHNYEQMSNFVTGSSDTAYPGAQELDQLAGTLCPTLDSIATDGKSRQLPTGFRESWVSPNENSWLQGDRIVRCYVSTSNGLSIGTIGSGTAKPSS